MVWGLLLAGCSYQVGSLVAKNDADVNETGSLGRPDRQPGHAARTVRPPEPDLAYARAAAADVLAHGGKDSSAPWQNPQTGARGNITPLSKSYSEGPFTCRDFLASYVHGEAQAWLQGEACRTDQGEWQVKSLVPLEQS